MISVHTLKNGETVIVNNMEDIIDIVSEKLSEDLGRALKEDLDEFIFDIKDERDALRDELESYEMDNEDYHDCILNNATDIEAIISDILNWKTITETRRQEIIDRLQNIYDDMWANV